MTGTEIRVTGLDENSFRTLHISILQKTNRAELTLGAAIHPHAYAWGIPRLFVLVPQMSPVRRLEDLKGLLVATTHDSKAENLLLSQKRLPFSVEVYVEPDDRSL